MLNMVRVACWDGSWLKNVSNKLKFMHSVCWYPIKNKTASNPEPVRLRGSKANNEIPKICTLQRIDYTGDYLCLEDLMLCN